MKKLSICIPTYNRQVFLDRAIQKILPQLCDDIEVIISDNCSTDNTQEYCQALVKNNDITYYRQPTNLGPDGNFLWCFNNAQGKYVMLIADDDYLAPDGVQKLLNFINSNDFTLGVSNICENRFDGNLNELIFKFSNNKKYMNADVNNFIMNVNIYLTFVSCLVFRRESLQKVENKEQFFGTNLLQTHIALAMLKYDMSAALISDAIVYSEINNSGGYNFFDVFINKWHDVLFNTALQSNLSKKAMVKTFNTTIGTLIKGNLVQYKINKLKTFNSTHMYKNLFKCWRYSNFWKYVLPILLCPTFILKKIRISRDKKRFAKYSN